MGEVARVYYIKFCTAGKLRTIMSSLATFFHFGILSFKAKSLRHFKHTQIVASLCPLSCLKLLTITHVV